MEGLGALNPNMGAGGVQPQAQATNQVNPRTEAAMAVVDDNIEWMDLDPRTKYALKLQEATDLVNSAEREMAMSQPSPMPNNVVDQRKMQLAQKMQSGIANLARQLSPGLQLRGKQMDVSARRAALEGGLPTQPAPNMQRMQAGGIVAFQDGGPTYDVQGGAGALWEGLKGLLAPIGREMVQGTTGPARQIVELTRAQAMLDPSSPEYSRIQSQIDEIRAGMARPAPPEVATPVTSEPVPYMEVPAQPRRQAPQAAQSGLPAIAAQQPTAPSPSDLERQRVEFMGQLQDPSRQRMDRLIAFLTGAGTGTSTSAALRQGAIGSQAEQDKQDALKLADLDKRIGMEREDSQAAAERQQRLEELATEYGYRYRQEMDSTRAKIAADYGEAIARQAADFMETLPTNPEFATELEARIQARKDEWDGGWLGRTNESAKLAIAMEEKRDLTRQYVSDYLADLASVTGGESQTSAYSLPTIE